MKSGADIYYDLAHMGQFNPSDPWETGTMTRTFPSAKQMKQMGDNRQTHYFRDDDDNRLVVITKALPNGEHVAWVEGNEGGAWGLGDTMMEAIADLHTALQ